MGMDRIWHVIGVQFNKDLNKDEFVDYMVEDCDSVDEATKKAESNGVHKITGCFLSSMMRK